MKSASERSKEEIPLGGKTCVLGRARVEQRGILYANNEASPEEWQLSPCPTRRSCLSPESEPCNVSLILSPSFLPFCPFSPGRTAKNGSRPFRQTGKNMLWWRSLMNSASSLETLLVLCCPTILKSESKDSCDSWQCHSHVSCGRVSQKKTKIQVKGTEQDLVLYDSYCTLSLVVRRRWRNGARG